MTAPADLWSFWDGTRAKLAETPMDAVRTPAPERAL